MPVAANGYVVNGVGIYLPITVQFVPSQYARTWLELLPVIVAPHVTVEESVTALITPSVPAAQAGRTENATGTLFKAGDVNIPVCPKSKLKLLFPEVIR